MICKLFEHVRARFDLALLQLGGDLDALGLLAGAIFERLFEGEVDEAADSSHHRKWALGERSTVIRSSAGAQKEDHGRARVPGRSD